MLSRFILLIASIFSMAGYSQELAYAAVPDALKENAVAVIRQKSVDIAIESRTQMVVSTRRVVTILNEQGLYYLGTDEGTDKATTVRSVEAQIYDASGQLLKKYKRKDFAENLRVREADVTDNKILSLNFVPPPYPFTVVYTSEVVSSNTAFIPSWTPVEGRYVSVQSAQFTIKSAPGLGLRYKEYNIGELKPEKKVGDSAVSFTISDIAATRGEEYSPSFNKLYPHVFFALEKFHLEGVDGEAKDWSGYGAWMYNSLITGTDELPAETQQKVRDMTVGETDPVKKAKILYEYMQSKTRYISIQLGIGGWKPMKAKDVDRLGYGDCKALSNYMRSLLKAAGMESYNAIIYGDSGKRDLLQDFASMQGNHMILAVPTGKESKYIWLECTSQHAPFGFLGEFTDDRLALVLKPTGGEIARTSAYDTKTNMQRLRGAYAISETGALSGNVVITSEGVQYSNKYMLESESHDEIVAHYKSEFNINNINIKKAALKNVKEAGQFIEDIALDAEAYCSKSGNRLIFTANAFNQALHIPQRYRARKSPLEIERGFIDIDEIVISLPKGYTLEAQPAATVVTDRFGEYKTEIATNAEGQLVYKRTLQINNGSYSSADYELYRQFREKIAKNDSAKIVLIKI
jgi:hypothetical protein